MGGRGFATNHSWLQIQGSKGDWLAVVGHRKRGETSHENPPIFNSRNQSRRESAQALVGYVLLQIKSLRKKNADLDGCEISMLKLQHLREGSCSPLHI